MGFTVKEAASPDLKGSVFMEKELIEEASTQVSSEITNEPDMVVAEPQIDQPFGELTDDVVVKYLNDKYGKGVSSIDDVFRQQEPKVLPGDVEAFLNYKNETGRGLEDFVKLNRDIDSLPEESLIREYLMAKNPGLDAEEIDVLMDEYDYDEEIDDSVHISKAKIAKKQVLIEAKNFLNSEKKKYMTVAESAPFSGIPNEEIEEYKAYKEYISQANTAEEENKRKREWFHQKTEELFSGEFKGFEFDVDGKKLSFSPGPADELKKIQSNPQNFIQRFLDENGLIADVSGYHKSLAVAMNPEKFAKYFYEQGQAEAVLDMEKDSKNISMTSVRSAPQVSKGNTGTIVRAVNPDSGNGLRIKSS
jgi:hypothetical protein